MLIKLLHIISDQYFDLQQIKKNNTTPGSAPWAAFAEQRGRSTEQQSWKVLMAVGDAQFAKGEWEVSELTHAFAP